MRSTPGGDPADGDSDGIPDACDNCVEVANANQRDTDFDGYGNICDADLNGDGLVTGTDYLLQRALIGGGNAHADLDGVGGVTTADYDILRTQLNGPPGPTGWTPLAGNSPPVADAGPDQMVAVGIVVNLDGSESSDPNGTPLDHAWSFSSRPLGSVASLSDPASEMPSFQPDLPGSYTIDLQVSDGTIASAVDSVVVSTVNSAPTADAGPDQLVNVGSIVTLDGSASDDVDGDSVTFQWLLVAAPAGSTAVLSEATAEQPTFVADLAGDYDFDLTVDDGSLPSAPDSVRISTINRAPVAAAGPDQVVFVNATVQLDGSGSSDPDGDGLNYSWTMLSEPVPGSVPIATPTSELASFVPDTPGAYVVQLVVDDGALPSAPDSLAVDVQVVSNAPTLDAVVSPTSSNPFTITGTAGAGDTVKLYREGVAQQTTTADGVGDFSFAALLADGLNNLHATIDFGGSESSASNSVIVEYLETVPRSQGGTITQDAVWTPGQPSQPFLVTTDLIVAAGVSLVLMPGTQVLFDSGVLLQVDGEFLAAGSAVSPVQLESSDPSPAAGDWTGLVVTSSATQFVLDHAEVRHAKIGVDFQSPSIAGSVACTVLCVRNSVVETNSSHGMKLFLASPWIDSNTIQGNNDDNLFIDDHSSPTIANNQILNSGTGAGDAGIEIRDGSSPTLTGNTITANRYGLFIERGGVSDDNPAPIINGNGIYSNTNEELWAGTFTNPTITTIDATGNWWNTTDPAVIAAEVHDQADISSSPTVDTSGFVTDPGPLNLP